MSFFYTRRHEFRKVGRNSKHFPTIKVDFLTNKVIRSQPSNRLIGLATIDKQQTEPR